MKYFYNYIPKTDLTTYQHSLRFINLLSLFKMSAQIDCPICMDAIELNKNCVTTECGHCFHASCLMTSVAHNGFGCPYCRTAMAEEPEEDESTEYESVDEEDEVDPLEDNDMLRGFRFFFNNINGEEHDPDDVEEEIANGELEEQNPEEDANPNVPTIDFVSQKLRERGVTFEQMVHMICNLDHEEFNEDEVAERFSDELFGMVRIIVSNYTPEQAVVEATTEPAVQETTIQPQVQEVDFAAQPKTTQVRIVPRFMIHV